MAPQVTARGPYGPPVAYRFEQDRISIGRSPSSHLVLFDPLLSREHAEIRRTDSGWIVADLGSRNGIEVNGFRVDRQAPLRAGDEIRLGDTVLVFDGGAGEGAAKASEAAILRQTTWSTRGDAGAAADVALVGDSAAMRATIATIDRYAPSRETVLITGENGTGKEMAARLLHARSPLGKGPFIAVNCPALPGPLFESELFGVERGVATGVEPRRGFFEAAQGGTIFLDEIGDLDLVAQSKLLRVLQEKAIQRLGGRVAIPLDARIVAATNHDLEADVGAGRFRIDLYHRLNALTLEIPPLRARPEDVPLLVAHFLRQPGGPAVTMGEDALAVLSAYDFPGNVRELEHVVLRARLLASGPVITPDDLPEVVRRRGGQAARAAAAPAQATSDLLYERIVKRGESFWSVVRPSYLRREVSREDVRALVARAHAEAGGSYKGAARLLRVPDEEHKRFLNFLGRHGLGVEH